MAHLQYNVAVLVHTCDRYRFLYPGFGFFFQKHWPANIPCQYYFATEVIDADLPGFINIKSGTGQWSDRLRVLLQNIKEDYVLYLQEDMWLCKDVDLDFFSQLFVLAERESWKQVKLNSSEVYVTEPTKTFINGFNIAKLDNEKSDFLMSHQATLWNRQFLLAQMAKDEHPWRNERRGTKRLKALDPTIFHIDYFSENGKPPINQNLAGASFSGYFTVSENSVLNDAVLPYIKKLQDGTEEEKKYSIQLEDHFKNALTHDGKPKPRKEDIFQKIKRKLRQRKS